MMRLRAEQIQALAPLAEEALVASILAYLRAYPAAEIQALDDAALRDKIEVGVARGRTYGLTWQSSLGAFVGLTLLVGPRFDEHPAARAVLTRPDVPPDERVRILADYLSDDDWRQAGSVR